MDTHSREIRSFFYSQYFSDGLRISIGVLVPSFILAQFGELQLGLTLSLGAVCICGVDSPGPTRYKRNAMLVCNALMFVVAMITGYARLTIYTLGVEIALFSFLFSMFTVYGTRATSVGTAVLLVMVFMIGKALEANEILRYSIVLTCGGIWYMVLSMVFFSIRPYRAAQQALAENITDVVRFLRIKADFYLPETNIESNYAKLVSQQVKVSEHQDQIRELLFKSRALVRESTNASRILILTFVDLVDMFEQILATHYDYNEMRERFRDTSILPDIANLLQQMANELDNIGYAILANSRYKIVRDFSPDLEKLKQHIDKIAAENNTSNLVLKKVLINLRDLSQKITDIHKYYNSKSSEGLIKKTNDVELVKFVNHQDFAPHILFDNLTFTSAAFKHALRVCLVCVAGFVATRSNGLLELVNFITGKRVVFGNHSYWVLLTIIVILKPGFSLSKQRNIQRVLGTLAGGLIGVVILAFVTNKTIEIVLLVFFMMGSYSFLRINYIVSVMFMTPYVLIVFRFLGTAGHYDVAKERIIDTIFGSILSIIASYTLFPSWESQQLRESLHKVLDANIRYLLTIADDLLGKPVTVTDFKLARKDVFVNSANLSATFERMVSEPKSKQSKAKDLHKFVVLNHILSSYLSTIAASLNGKKVQHLRADNFKLMRRSIAVLNDNSKKLGGKSMDLVVDKLDLGNTLDTTDPDQQLLKEQLNFVNKISVDIGRITDNLILQ
ncbi:FUSC family membrane protein [Mucilaginibacter ginkgonis]|uniref:FUSC family protein n=1 Tax=Mucilaginibacter ginkgonis TaxID=2682091 RepID=A0A6I4HVX9_9SPHI|nr:FUSC family membrane protein [Mucilaginibacter ginkgonis]QQL51103.1 FUSC family protein [Mucilaginibacter ginkgonis]